MIYRNQAGQGIYLIASAAGDAANITGAWSLDGAEPTSGFDTAHPTEIGNGAYWQPLTAAETDGEAYLYAWTSTSPGVTVTPEKGFTAGVDVRALSGVPYYAYDAVLAGATASTVTLPATKADGTAIPDDGSFANTGLYVYSGTGTDQWVVLTTPTSAVPNGRVYNSLRPTNGVTLDSTSRVQFVGRLYTQWGTIAAATATTVTLPETDSLGVSIPDDGRYQNTALWIAANTGAGQVVQLGEPTSAPPNGREYSVVAGSMPRTLDATSIYYVMGTSTARLDHAQVLAAPRVLDAVADADLTVADALHAAIATAAGDQTEVGVAYTVKTPAGTVIRNFMLDSSSQPTSRT